MITKDLPELRGSGMNSCSNPGVDNIEDITGPVVTIVVLYEGNKANKYFENRKPT